MTKTPCSQGRGPGFHPRSGSQIPHAASKTWQQLSEKQEVKEERAKSCHEILELIQTFEILSWTCHFLDAKTDTQRSQVNFPEVRKPSFIKEWPRALNLTGETGCQDCGSFMCMCVCSQAHSTLH